MAKEKIVIGPKGKRGAWRTLPGGRRVFIEEKYLKAEEDWRKAYKSDFMKWIALTAARLVTWELSGRALYHGIIKNPHSLWGKVLKAAGLTGLVARSIMGLVGDFYLFRGIYRYFFKRPKKKKKVKRAAETTNSTPALIAVGTQELPNPEKNLFWRAVIISTVAVGLYLESKPEALDELKQVVPIKFKASGFTERELLQLNAGFELARDALGTESSVAKKLREIIKGKPQVKDLKVSKVKTIWLNREMKLTTRNKAVYAITWGLSKADNFVLGIFVRLRKE